MKSTDQIFELYTLSDLHTKLGYSEQYLVKLKEGYRPIPDRFKRFASAILGKTVRQLFREVGNAA